MVPGQSGLAISQDSAVIRSSL